jgi:TPR repeat protein
MYFEEGREVEVNDQRALEWYEKSATQGYYLAKDRIKYLNIQGYFIDTKEKRKYFFLYFTVVYLPINHFYFRIYSN